MMNSELISAATKKFNALVIDRVYWDLFICEAYSSLWHLQRTGGKNFAIEQLSAMLCLEKCMEHIPGREFSVQV